MEGMILAAGLGTRLRPLTDSRPKALVEVAGRTLLDRTICRLAEADCNHVVVNVYCMADMIIDYLCSRSWPCCVEVSDERPLLLDTGGALRRAANLFHEEGEVIVHNVDVLSRIDLSELHRQHRLGGHLVTLCCSHRPTARPLLFCNGQLAGRAAAGENDGGLAFSGVSMVSSRLFALLPAADRPFPIIDEYIRLATEGYRIAPFLHAATDWLDVGRPETLERAAAFVQ